MSKISLKHSGGNVVSLNSPTNAPGAADVAFKLPNADGSAGQFIKTDGSGNLSFDAAGGGKILQVITVLKTDSFSTSVQVTSSADVTGLSVNITPSSASNKIMVFASIDCFTERNHCCVCSGQLMTIENLHSKDFRSSYLVQMNV